MTNPDITASTTPRINRQRLIQLLHDFAQFGLTARHGVSRLALTQIDRAARNYLIELSQAAGFQVRIDAIGNIFIRRHGSHDLPVVMTGSHGDSQPQGGRYDGIYGVLAGLEALLSLNDANITTLHPIELVMWTNEEGARFAPAMMGSAVYTGQLKLETAYAIHDQAGISVKEALQDIHYLGHDQVAGQPIKAYIEAHIEQGPILEQEQYPIGVVHGAFAQRWFNIELTGMAAHAGTTPLHLRQDAVLGMAHCISALNQLALQPENQDVRLTVGMVQVQPNSRNVVADKALFTIDVRHHDDALLDRLTLAINTELQHIAQKYALTIHIDPCLNMPAIHFSPECCRVIEDAARKHHYAYKSMISGAGHDACHLSTIAPTAMIFIPCIKGISHNEAEAITDEWAHAGATVLLESLLTLAQNHESEKP
ncbi:Zn-dependent hydrolase [Neisseriaceae bacterium ESL0693]|nr:Zn-dependent hydrolase [Neisseriaceae bacterium ESL0693]